MSFAKRHNLPNITFTHNTPEGLNFISLLKLWEDSEDNERVHTVRRIYINNEGHYGPAPVIITDTHRVNAPGYMTRECESILRSAQDIQAINDGKVGFKLIPYMNEHGEQYRIRWVDIQPETKQEQE